MAAAGREMSGDGNLLEAEEDEEEEEEEEVEVERYLEGICLDLGLDWGWGAGGARPLSFSEGRRGGLGLCLKGGLGFRGGFGVLWEVVAEMAVTMICDLGITSPRSLTHSLQKIRTDFNNPFSLSLSPWKRKKKREN